MSVAHSGELTVAVWAPAYRSVGIDIELVRPRPRLAALARRTMDDAEFERWTAVPAAARLVAFHEHWVRLEAALKARGTGLSGGLRWRPPVHWSVVPVTVPDGYVCAVAVDAAPVRIEWLPPGE